MILQPAVNFGGIGVCVLAVMAVAGEYSTGMIRASLLAMPQRLPMLAAKAVVLAVVVFAVGELAAVAAFGLGRTMVDPRVHLSLTDPALLRAIPGFGLYLCVLGLFALGIGALVRHVAGAIATARPDSGVDMLLGIGGTPEGIIAAAALRCMGGELHGQLAPTDDDERQKALDAGHDLDRVLTTRELVTGENIFFCATGVTDGDLLKGVRYYGGGATTQSIVMRSKSGTVRMVEAYHRLEKLGEFSSIDFHGVEGAAPPMP
jgi:hypothetical protein